MLRASFFSERFPTAARFLATIALQYIDPIRLTFASMVALVGHYTVQLVQDTIHAIADISASIHPILGRSFLLGLHILQLVV